MAASEWLTLSQMVKRANISETEAERIIIQFGKFLAARNFGDIIKYPPSTMEAVSLIADLYRQGWQTEEIIEILSEQACPAQEDHSIPHCLEQEVRTSLQQHDRACQLMDTAFELVMDLMADVLNLKDKVSVLEEEIKHLKKQVNALDYPRSQK
jgi:hypothetical protein